LCHLSLVFQCFSKRPHWPSLPIERCSRGAVLLVLTLGLFLSGPIQVGNASTSGTPQLNTHTGIRNIDAVAASLTWKETAAGQGVRRCLDLCSLEELGVHGHLKCLYGPLTSTTSFDRLS
jgi:hypothetical protein